MKKRKMKPRPKSCLFIQHRQTRCFLYMALLVVPLISSICRVNCLSTNKRSYSYDLSSRQHHCRHLPVLNSPVSSHYHHCHNQKINEHETYAKEKSKITKLQSSAKPNDDFEVLPSDSNNGENRAIGVLVLLTVPLAWGTYAPVVKYVYELDPPVPGFIFSLVYYLIASISLITIMNIRERGEIETYTNSADGDASQIKSNLPIQGGLELGSYLFIGNCLQVVGLESVPADRAAFLVQLTTIMVPLFSAISARNLLAINTRTWIACILAFSGVTIMGLDGKDLNNLGSYDGATGVSSFVSSSISTLLDTFTGGDVLIILSAVAYTLHVIRLGRYAQYTTPLRLAAAKATTEAILSLILVWSLYTIGSSKQEVLNDPPAFINKLSTEITSFTSNFYATLESTPESTTSSTPTLLLAAGACIWTGLVTCAYTIYAQSFGQRRVSPTDANLIYTTQPLFSAMFAWFLLGETLGPAGFVGGTFIGAALWLITNDDDDKNLLFSSQKESDDLKLPLPEDQMKSTTAKSNNVFTNEVETNIEENELIAKNRIKSKV